MGQERTLPANKGDSPAFLDLVESEMALVDAILTNALTQDNPLVQTVSDYLMEASGKRLRPALVLLSGRFGAQCDEGLYRVAAAVEMIHMATLVHDDIIDHATMRRGLPALHSRFSEKIAVLAGDFLFAQAFQIFAQSGDARIVEVAANVVRSMCSGEIAQQLDNGRVATEAEYLRRIGAKTADFVEASCRIGALKTLVEPDLVEVLGQFGYNLGMAFQIIDDLLDWEADPERLGKAVGEDVTEGVFTLPLIHAMEHPEYHEVLSRMLTGDTKANVSDMRSVLATSGGLAYARDMAERYALKALDLVGRLPDGPVREAFSDLAGFVVRRDF